MATRGAERLGVEPDRQEHDPGDHDHAAVDQRPAVGEARHCDLSQRRRCEEQTDEAAGERVTRLAELLGEKDRGDRPEQACDGRAREPDGRTLDEDGPHLLRHCEPLQSQPELAAADGLRCQRERDSGRREQRQVDDERKTERRRRVVGDHPGDQRPQAEAAEVDDDRDQAGEPPAVSWTRSTRAAVAVPVKMPAESPDRILPA